MSPPHHPEPPERALEPQFVAAQGLGHAHVSGGGTRLDGPTPTRPAARSLLPWLLLAGAVAAAGWALMTVVLPLRREALQCQAQLLAAQSAFAVPADVDPAAGFGIPAGDTASQDSVDALVERLVMALAPEAALGQVAVHPDEGCVRVVVPGDVASHDVLTDLFVRVGRQACAMPNPWRAVLEVGRPVGGGGRSPFRKHKNRESDPPQLLLRVLAAADEAFDVAPVPWLMRLVSLPEGGVVLRLEALSQAGGQTGSGGPRPGAGAQ